MNLYEIAELENDIEKTIIDNDGEIDESLLQELIEAQTQSIEKVENTCKYIRHLELFIDKCKEEEIRIKDLRKSAENRVNSIKKYLTPYVFKHKKIQVGTFNLSIRKSQSVVIADGFSDARFITVIQENKINKNDIKKAIKNGEDIKGAILADHENLQIR